MLLYMYVALNTHSAEDRKLSCHHSANKFALRSIQLKLINILLTYVSSLVLGGH